MVSFTPVAELCRSLPMEEEYKAISLEPEDNSGGLAADRPIDVIV